MFTGPRPAFSRSVLKKVPRYEKRLSCVVAYLQEREDVLVRELASLPNGQHGQDGQAQRLSLAAALFEIRSALIWITTNIKSWPKTEAEGA